jgi:hypothetical protein
MQGSNVPLIIDLASPMVIGQDQIGLWASNKRVFISSTITDMKQERMAAREAVLTVGAVPIMWETIAPRDEEPNCAYIEGVRGSDLYLLFLKTRYGIKLPSGYSPTNEEYEEARRRGLPIFIWIDSNYRSDQRDGHLNTWISELRNVHSTGDYEKPEDLNLQVVRILKDIAAEDLIQWAKLGDAIFPVESVYEAPDRFGRGGTIIVTKTRDRDVQRYLERAADGRFDVPFTYRGHTRYITVEKSQVTTNTGAYQCQLNCRINREPTPSTTVQVSYGIGGGWDTCSPFEVATALIEEALSGIPNEKLRSRISFLPTIRIQGFNQVPESMAPLRQRRVLELLITEGVIIAGLVQTALVSVIYQSNTYIANLEADTFAYGGKSPIIKIVSPIKM